MKYTYYIVQKSEHESIYDDKQKRLSLSEARRVLRKLKETNHDDAWGRRFPRIIKVTTEYKTITK